jgi:DNA segregation ATPase FtsK/SpoIIIE-like protein
MGADKLLGKGDMLYLPPGSAKLIRAQGALITDQEILGIVDFIAKQAKPSYELEIHQQLSKATSTYDEESGCDEDEEIIEQMHRGHIVANRKPAFRSSSAAFDSATVAPLASWTSLETAE